MEKKQLNFNAPLLSARRYSSPSHSTELGIHKVSVQQYLPVKRSEWEKEGLAKPAAVPFHWEQIPGRPKYELESQASNPDKPYNTPRLPPARVSGAIRRSGPSRYNSGERSNDHSGYSRAQADPCLYNDHAMLLEKLNESLDGKDESDCENGDAKYSDAVVAHSVRESCSLDCSVSGLSGYQSSGVKPSETFCVDKQTREFMMDRFLPAAKAAVIEAPQYVVKKPSVVNEPPKLVRKAVSGEIRPLPKLYSLTALPHYIENVESEDDDHESEAPAKKPGKVWGILPRFSMKNSFCLLNPMPGIKSGSGPGPGPRARTPPPLSEVKRLTRRALSGPLDKACQYLQEAHPVPNKKKSHSGVLSRDLIGVEFKPNHDAFQFLNTRDSVKSTISPLRRYRSGNVSPRRNESSKSPFRQSIVPNGVANQNANNIASSRKMFKALLDVSRNQVNEKGPTCPAIGYAVEKTLYVDFIRKTEVSISMPPAIKQTEDTNAVKSEERKKLSPEKVDNISDAKLGTEETKLKSNDTKVLDPPLKSAFPPPLPKSPSESWLWHTLPSIPLGNPFAHSRQRNHQKGQKGSTTDTKWETIVKTSNLRHDHVQCSPELTAHSSYRQKL